MRDRAGDALRRGAERSGRAVAVLGRVVTALGRIAPGIAGPLLISYAGLLAWRPLGFAFLGAFLVWADRRIG
jgi:hypothetical protein